MPLASTTRGSPLAARGGTMGEKWWPNGAWDMPQICDMGPIILLPFRRKACWGFFLSPFKNPTASAGFEPANLGTKGQHATSPPPKPLYLTDILWQYFVGHAPWGTKLLSFCSRLRYKHDTTYKKFWGAFVCLFFFFFWKSKWRREVLTTLLCLRFGQSCSLSIVCLSWRWREQGPMKRR